MDRSENYLKAMPSQEKYSNIYINPKFNNDSVKSVIHINPKVHLNMAIHVNPKMVNALSTCRLRQIQQSQIRNPPIQGPQDLLKTKIQKSVYVNPKLMEKLTHKVPDASRKRANPVQPQITNESTAPQLKAKTVVHINRHVIVQKSSPSNLVSLSRRKLVRVRSATKSVLTNTSSSSNDKVMKALRPVAMNRSKKFNLVDRRATIVNKSKSSVRSTSTNTRFKIDRTGIQKKKISKVKSSPRKGAVRANTNLIKIDGVLYKSSKSQLVKSNNSSNRSTTDQKRRSSSSIAVSSSKKTAKIKSTIAKTIINRYSTSNVAQRSNYKYILSNRVKQKSIQILRHKMTKNNQPCLLFQRFGYCAKYAAGTCPKVHDKKQVALCKNFLQGKCLLDNCPLSHEVGPEKMPTCKYFLDGCCIRDACPYLHVKVSANTPICIPFLQGYCAKGNKCKERHTNVCPEFEKTGKCAKGKNCPYPHKTVFLAQHRSSQNTKKTTFNKQTVSKKKSEKPLPPRDESKKRYYDDNSCTDETLVTKKMKILQKINVMKNVHTGSESNSLSILSDSTIDSHNAHQQLEEHSQPCHQNVQYKRPPIGPLPAYIPIE